MTELETTPAPDDLPDRSPLEVPETWTESDEGPTEPSEIPEDQRDEGASGMEPELAAATATEVPPEAESLTTESQSETDGAAATATEVPPEAESLTTESQSETESAAESAWATESETDPQTETESATETAPEAGSMVAPEFETEMAPDAGSAAADTQSAPEGESEAEQGSEAEADAAPDAESAAADTESTPEGGAEAGSESATETASESETEVAPEAESATESVSETDVVSESAWTTESGTGSQTETDSPTETAPDAGSVAADTESAPEDGSEVGPESETETAPEPVSDWASEPVADWGSAAYTASDAESIHAEAEPTPATEAETSTDIGAGSAEEPEPVAAEGPRTVGRYIADMLRAAGVRYAFTVPGESFLGLLDAFEGAGIRVVSTRHENAAAFMAEAHGQLTGRPAVCIATRAVGGANLAIGIHTARADSTPMFVLIGQVGRSLRGREAFQEADHVESLGRLAKWAAEPGSGSEVVTVMAEASRQALGGRPGPVVLSLSEDLLDEPMPDDVRADAGRPGTTRPTDEEIRAVIELLASAERPVILAGGGILRARTSTELTRFAELLQVPIIAAWRRADVISNDHDLYLGMAGFGAAASVRERLDAADALVVIGSRLNEPTTYAYTVPRPGLRWAHVDLAPGAASGSTPPEFSVVADAKAFLKAANERLLGRAVLDAARVATRQAANREDRAAFEAASIVDAIEWDGPGVHPGRTIATLRRILPDDGILTTDAGNFASWAGRGFRFRRPGTFLGPTSGAMGYGLPAAIAAALVHRDRPVVALVGDGGLGMTMAELETAVRVGARVVVVVFDNERYGTIRMWQERRGTGVGVATELGPVDFAAIGRACGARGVRVQRDDEFEPALRAALASDRATVIQLALDRAWLSIDDLPA